MQKYFALLLIGLCWFGIPTAMAQTKSNQNIYVEEETIEERQRHSDRHLICGTYYKPIRVGGLVTNPPFGWVNARKIDNRIFYTNDGFSYELFAKMAKSLDLNIENVGFPSFSEAILALRKGEIDVLAGAYYDRHILGVGTSLLFPGYFKNQIIVIFPKGKEKKVRSYDDLKGLRGVVRQEEMLYSLAYQQLRDLPIEQVSGARNAFTKLLTGEADYMLSSLYAAEAEVRRFKLVDDISFSDYALTQPELFFVLSVNSRCANEIRPLFSKMLTEEMKDQNAYFSYFLTFLDAWGDRFRDAPSLLEQIHKKTEVPEELIEPITEQITDEEPASIIDVSQGTPVPPPAPEEL